MDPSNTDLRRQIHLPDERAGVLGRRGDDPAAVAPPGRRVRRVRRARRARPRCRRGRSRRRAPWASGAHVLAVEDGPWKERGSRFLAAEMGT